MNIDKRSAFFFIFVGFFLFAFPVFTQTTVKTVQDFTESLRVELGFIPEEFRIIDASLNNLLVRGVTQDELRSLMLEFKDQGIRRIDFFKDPLDSMNELLKVSESTHTVLALVRQFIHDAHASGLKGNALALRVNADLQHRLSIIKNLKAKQKIDDLRNNKGEEKKFKKAI